jgi:hypothetical protein
MSSFDDRRRPVSDHERAASESRSKSRPAVSDDLKAAGSRERIAEAMRVAPVVLIVLAFFLLPDGLASLAPHPVVRLASFAGIAILIGLVGGAVIFLARPPRVIALAWFLVVEAIIGLSIFNLDSGLEVLAVPYRLLALGFVTTVVAGISAISPTGWRPPPILWEE